MRKYRVIEKQNCVGDRKYHIEYKRWYGWQELFDRRWVGTGCGSFKMSFKTFDEAFNHIQALCAEEYKVIKIYDVTCVCKEGE